MEIPGSEAEHQCTICNKPAALRCSQCTGLWYCGKPCQKEDWSVHKLLCSQWKDFRAAPLDKENVYRAIRFSETKTEPLVTFMWISPSEIRSYVSPARIREITRNSIRNRPLKKVLSLWHRNKHFLDGAGLNEGVIATTKGMAIRPWAGPVFVTKDSIDRTISRFSDIDIGDFRDAADYLVSHGRDPGSDSEADEALSAGPSKNMPPMLPTTFPSSSSSSTATTKKPTTGKTVKGVRINCHGDVENFGHKKYEAVEVPISSIDNRSYTIPPLSTRVGMQLKLKRLREPAGREGRDRGNQAVTFLHLSEDMGESWGWAPSEWMRPAGSVIVVRADGEDLHPLHAEALCHFGQFYAGTMFEDSIGSGVEPPTAISKEEVLYRISPKSFQLFYSGWMASKLRRTDEPPFPKIDISIRKARGLRKNFRVLSEFL